MEILKPNCIWDLSMNSTLDIWSEKWIPGVGFPIFPSVIDEETPTKISDLISLNGQWNKEVIDVYFSQDVATKILTLPVPNAAFDELKWLHTKGGIPTVKSVYRTLTNDLGTSDPIWKNIWGLKCQPRVQLFLWKLHSNVLPFNNRLARFTRKASPICCLCYNN